MQVLQLQYFCAVARHGNISRAAEELWISQSALSKAIGALEDELEVRLFERIGRSISLNEAGRLFLAQVTQILQQLDDSIKQARDIYGRSNRVRLLMSAANFSSHWIWQSFRLQHPAIDLQVNSCYTVTQYDIMQNDFHIFATPHEFENTACLQLVEEELYLAMGRHHPLAAQENVSLADTKPYLYQTLTPNENLRANLASFCRSAGFVPQIGFCTEDSFTYFEMLASNDYLALVPSITASSALHADLILKTVSEPRCYRTVYLGWNDNRYMSAADRVFVDFCRELFKEPYREPMAAEK